MRSLVRFQLAPPRPCSGPIFRTPEPPRRCEVTASLRRRHEDRRPAGRVHLRLAACPTTVANYCRQLRKLAEAAGPLDGLNRLAVKRWLAEETGDEVRHFRTRSVRA